MNLLVSTSVILFAIVALASLLFFVSINAKKWSARLLGIRSVSSSTNSISFVSILKPFLKHRSRQGFPVGFILQLFYFGIIFFSLSQFFVLPIFETTTVAGIEISGKLLETRYDLMFYMAIALCYSLISFMLPVMLNSDLGVFWGIKLLARNISADILIFICILTTYVTYRDYNVSTIVASQALQLGSWGILLQPITAILFLFAVALKASVNPFSSFTGLDNAEELVSGNLMPLGYLLVRVASSLTLIANIVLFISLFFGGYNLPFHISFFSEGPMVIAQGLVVLAVKSLPVLILLKWMHELFPRLGYRDLVLKLWTKMYIAAVANLVLMLTLTAFWN